MAEDLPWWRFSFYEPPFSAVFVVEVLRFGLSSLFRLTHSFSTFASPMAGVASVSYQFAKEERVSSLFPSPNLVSRLFFKVGSLLFSLQNLNGIFNLGGDFLLTIFFHVESFFFFGFGSTPTGLPFGGLGKVALSPGLTTEGPFGTVPISSVFVVGVDLLPKLPTKTSFVDPLRSPGSICVS